MDANENDSGVLSSGTLTTISSDDRFRFTGQDFRESIDALRETHDELASAAEKLDDLQQVLNGTLEVPKKLSNDERKLIARAFKGIPEEGLRPSEFIDRVWDAVAHTDWGPTFAVNLANKLYRPRRQPIFHNAMLISLVAAFEAHLTKLATEYYRGAPSALHDLPREAMKEFSLKDLQGMNSIDDAIEVAIEARIVKLMYGSLADWKKFFADRMNISMDGLSESWETIREIFERRHCIVHSEARASRRYVAAVKGATLHQHIDATPDYVRSAIDSIELLGVLLHGAVWEKFATDKQEVVDALEATGFEALKASRWDFSLALYERWQALPLSEEEQRMAKVNIWIAKKELFGGETVIDEIAAWDVSGSDELFKFAKLCLLEDLDGAFEMIPILIERDKMDGKSLATWPLTSGLRKDPRIRDYADLVHGYLAVTTEKDEEPESNPAVSIEKPSSDTIADPMGSRVEPLQRTEQATAESSEDIP